MRIFQQLSASCACAVCGPGCLCGDCAACSNPNSYRVVGRNATRISALLCLAMVLGGVVFFAPVVTLGATPPLTPRFSVKLQAATNSTAPMGSISFCLFGKGAVYVNDTYYPSITLNDTSPKVCAKG